MKNVTKNGLSDLDLKGLNNVLDQFHSVWLDIGTGDGSFPRHMALEDRSTLYIGLDLEWTRLKETAHEFQQQLRKIRKRRRSEAQKKMEQNLDLLQEPIEAPSSSELPNENLILIVGDITELPTILPEKVNKVTANYPWGSLLQYLTVPNLAVLQAIFKTLRPGGTFEIFINYHVFGQNHQTATLNLPELTKEFIELHLSPAFTSCGFQWLGYQLTDQRSKYRTTWGYKLTKGSGRPTLEISLSK